MEITSSTINDLRSFVRRGDVLPDVNDGVERSFIGTVFQILLHQNGFGFSIKVVKSRMVLATFPPDAKSSTMVVRIIVSPNPQRRWQDNSVIVP
jgi:hypothetical protein